MHKFLNVLLLTAALSAPLSLAAQDRHDQSPKVYQDQRHHDTHEWNDTEDQQYRSYLKERHKKYVNFDKQNSKTRNSYWDWRHQH